MARKRKKKNSLGNKILTYLAWSLAVATILLGTLFTGYYFGYEDAKVDLAKKHKYEKQKIAQALKKPTKVAKKEKDSVNKRLQDVLKKENVETKHKKVGASHEYDDAVLAKPPLREKREVKKSSSKPKLAIIIDDVSVRSHVEAIKNIGLPLTMSFLPPSSYRPNSAKLASKENFYMVHLPMEATKFNAEEPFTLKTKDSQQKISNRIKDLKKLFPRVKYINNHTGSKFTSNEASMNKLIFVLNKQHINFIDSRTTAKTTAPKVMKNYGLKYVARDIFLDHKMEKPYIISQIKKAIKLAKAHGTAIAIGHPHASTLLALKESKNLFKDVDLVYVNKLY